MTFAYDMAVYWALVLIAGWFAGFLSGWLWSQTRYRKWERQREERLKRIAQLPTGINRSGKQFWR